MILIIVRYGLLETERVILIIVRYGLLEGDNSQIWFVRD